MPQAKASRPLYCSLGGFDGMVYFYDLKGRLNMLHYVKLGLVDQTAVERRHPLRMFLSPRTVACAPTAVLKRTLGVSYGGSPDGYMLSITHHLYRLAQLPWPWEL